MNDETRTQTNNGLDTEEETSTTDEPVALEQDQTEIDEQEFASLLGAREYEFSTDIEQIWMREIGSVPLLSNKEVIAIAREVESGEVLNEVEYTLYKENNVLPDGPQMALGLLGRLVTLEPVASIMARHAGVTDKSGILAIITDPTFQANSDAVYTAELMEELLITFGTKSKAEHAIRELSVAPRLLPHEVIEVAGANKAAADLAKMLTDEAFKARLSEMESELTQHYQGIKQDAKKGRDQLVQANMRLVVSVAKRHLNWGLPLLDLVQEGAVGLMRAVEKFEYRKGYRFSTYATWWIMQAVRRAVDEQGRMIRIPVHMAEKMHKLNRTRRNLTMESGREATAEELSTAMEASPDLVEMLDGLQHLQPISLDLPVGEEGDTSLGDLVEDESSPAPEELAVSSVLRDQIREMLAELPPREQTIIELRFGLTDGREWTLEEVGKTMNLTRERIRQLEKAALRKLRKPSRVRMLVGALD